MKPILWRYYWREFRLRKKKAALITFALFWGTFSILMLMAFGRGLSTQFQVSFKGLGDNLIMIGGGQSSRTYQGLPKGRRIRIYPEDIPLLKRRIAEIAVIVPETYDNETISYNGKESNRQVHGIWADFSVLRSQVPMAGGRFINVDDVSRARRVAFMGWLVAENLFGGENPIGKTVVINRVPFTVVGVLQKKLQDSMYNGPDAEQVYVPLSAWTAISSQKYLDRIHIGPRTPSESLLVENRARVVLGEKYRFDPEDQYALRIWNTITENKEAAKIFKGIEIFLGLIGAFTLLIGAVGVTNLMYAVVKERTREIGIKLAMGAKRSEIVWQFILETLFIFIKGTSWGVLVVWNLINLLHLIPINYDSFGVDSYLLRPQFSVDIFLIFISVIGTLIFLAGIFPAYQASRLNPVESLRYE